MTRVIVAAADQALAQQIQGSLLELDDAEVAFVATSSSELTQAVLREQADVALVHEELGPEPVLSQLRDLSIRRPATAMLLVATDPDADMVTQAMESGARGLVSLPLSLGQLEGRLTAAAAWSAQMRRLLAPDRAGGMEEDSGRGRIVGFAGAKGGVGVTTIACHLALDIVRTVPSVEVCLVDLDLEAGDVPGLVEVRHRVGIADLAKVADDLSPGTVADAMTRHSSGVDMLLAPPDVRDVEPVTPRALRLVLAALRREYDLVLVDLGAHVTPAQATALEMADEVVVVVNPDVAALRGLRRSINAWESLGVCKESDLRVLLNRSSKQVTVSLETVRQLTRASVLPVGVPAGFRRLEPPLNARDPLELRNPQWWATLRQIGREIGLVPQTRERRRRTAVRETAVPGAGPAAAPGVAPAAASAAAPEPAGERGARGARSAPEAPDAGGTGPHELDGTETARPGAPPPSWLGPPAESSPAPAGAPASASAIAPAPASAPAESATQTPVAVTTDSRATASTATPRAPGASAATKPVSRRHRRGRSRDKGSLTLESIALIPLFFAIAGLVWHMALYGSGAVLHANAAAAAARAASIGLDPQAAAEDTVPGYLRGGIDVRERGTEVTVTMAIPGVVEGFPGVPTTLTTTREVVPEPSRGGL